MLQAEKVQPIQFQRKIRNPKMVNTIHSLSYEWGLSAQDTIYRLINEAVNREFLRKEKEKN